MCTSHTQILHLWQHGTKDLTEIRKFPQLMPTENITHELGKKQLTPQKCIKQAAMWKWI